MMKVVTLATFLILSLQTCFAKEIRHLMRSPQALLMGDAFTARADDEYTLFYNPAGLGRNSGAQIKLINPNIGVTNALDELDRFEDFPSSDASAISQRLMGFPVFVQLGATPTMKIGPFGFNLFANSTTSLSLRNATHPALDVDYRLDRGFIFGFAYSVGSGGSADLFKLKSDRGPKSGKRCSYGIGIKHMNRQGLKNKFDVFSVELLNTIANGVDSYSDLRDALGFSKGKGWGGDLGLDCSVGGPMGELSFGASILDVFDTKFIKSSGDYDIPRQDMYINTGVAWKQDFGIFDYALSFDLHPINEPIEFGQMAHFGLEVGIPLIRAYGGWNGGYISYGAKFNVWPFEITAGFYGVELGSNFKEQKGSRAVIHLSLLDIEFDL